MDCLIIFNLYNKTSDGQTQRALSIPRDESNKSTTSASTVVASVSILYQLRHHLLDFLAQT